MAKEEPDYLQQRQSELVKAMRFPLIVLVVICHALTFATTPMTPALSGEYAFHFFTEMLSHNFGRIAVCWFFVFSGYFFFYNLKEDKLWTSEGFAYKWKKRIWTLLVPYVIWNLILVLLTVVKVWGFSKIGIDSSEEMVSVKNGPLYWLVTGPANFPLWYMRDLMIMSILAPILYYVFKYLGIWGFLPFAIAYLSPWNPNIPGMRAIFFFSAGAYMGIHKINMLEICRRWKLPVAIFAVILLLVSTYFNESRYHESIIRVFYPFGMMTFMNICDSWLDNAKFKERSIKLSATVFFIYATHEIYILGWTKGLVLRLLGGSLFAQWAGYFLIPVIVLGVCILLYRILERLCPRALAFVCGGRVK